MEQRNYLEMIVSLQKQVLEVGEPITEADKSLLVYLDWFYGSSLANRSRIPKEDLKIIIDGIEHLLSVLETNKIADSVKEFVDKFPSNFRFTLDCMKEEYELDDATRKEYLKGLGTNITLKGFDETH